MAKTQKDLVKMSNSLSEITKKVYYNAGRYVAGARDKTAVSDYFRLSVMEAAKND